MHKLFSLFIRGSLLVLAMFYVVISLVLLVQSGIEISRSAPFTFFNALIFVVLAVFMLAIAGLIWRIRQANTVKPVLIVLIIFVVSLTLLFGQGVYDALSSSNVGIGPLLPD